jgi:hypothetical protein
MSIVGDSLTWASIDYLINPYNQKKLINKYIHYEDETGEGGFDFH